MIAPGRDGLKVDAAMDRVAAVLTGLRTSWRTEGQLQLAIADVLANPVHGFTGRREFTIDRGSRIDFNVTVDGLPIGLEVKTAGGVIDVARQIQRYASTDVFSGVLLVTSKPRHRQLPETLAGVPVRVVLLQAGAW